MKARIVKVHPEYMIQLESQHYKYENITYHCNEKRSNKPSIRNSTQKCDNYNINYTQGKYRTSDNYDNDNYNCNYKN